MCESYPGARYHGVLGQQNDGSRDFVQRKCSNETWDRLPQSCRDEWWQAEPPAYETSSADDSDRALVEQVTSPPLSSFSVLLKDADELGADLDFGSFSKDAAAENASDRFHDDLYNAMTMQDATDLVNFKLGQSKRAGDTTGPAAIPVVPPEDCTYPVRPLLDYQSFSSSDDDDAMIFSRASRFNSAGLTSSTENYRSNTASGQNDRGFRKKSREKMRRQEVNVKFEMLVNLLGLSSRVRKKNVLHEAASAVKNLKRECNQLRHDRDFLQLELHRMSAYLQFAEDS